MKEALGKLMDGNNRYVVGKSSSYNFESKRGELVNNQNPKAVAVTCSDSRTPPEIIFDQNIGDLFVIRTAGNVLDSVSRASLEYALRHFNTPVVLIMAHGNCGAIKTALENDEESGFSDDLINLIQIIRKNIVSGDGNLEICEDKTFEKQTIANAKGVISELKSLYPEFQNLFVPAFYNMKSGKVDLV